MPALGPATPAPSPHNSAPSRTQHTLRWMAPLGTSLTHAALHHAHVHAQGHAARLPGCAAQARATLALLSQETALPHTRPHACAAPARPQGSEARRISWPQAPRRSSHLRAAPTACAAHHGSPLPPTPSVSKRPQPAHRHPPCLAELRRSPPLSASNLRTYCLLPSAGSQGAAQRCASATRLLQPSTPQQAGPPVRYIRPKSHHPLRLHSPDFSLGTAAARCAPAPPRCLAMPRPASTERGRPRAHTRVLGGALIPQITLSPPSNSFKRAALPRSTPCARPSQ
ncbi:MAG: hypothetical protein J3K34DRAFT_216689 [Monoraphidium minutum]|nr:MAG: hypothetical protein J3K34DRAFT_216689 [Monoraphidium minutum]